MKLTLKNLTNEEKKFYNSLVKTVGKDSLSDIAKYGCGGGISGIIYYNDIFSFVSKNKEFIRNLLQSNIDEGILTPSEYYLFKDKLDSTDIIKINNFILGGKLPSDGIPISWIGWYAIESFVFNLID